MCSFCCMLLENKVWRFIGDCPCGGQDQDCADNDDLWELVDAPAAGES